MGLEKLLTAEKEVNIMKQELIELQPKLIETGERSSAPGVVLQVVRAPGGDLLRSATAS